MNILFMGPQGSGKGTQAKLISEKYGFNYFETGDILREIAKQKSSFGKSIDEKINRKGKLVSDKTIRKVVNEWLNAVDLKKGLIFDGFPRNIKQCQLLEKMLLVRKSQIDKVILLDISRSESFRRLSGRRVCPVCDKEYNLLTKPPQNDQLCDQCRVRLVKRKDDLPKTIKKRLETYHQLTEPLIYFYRKKGILEEIDGERPIEVIFEDIVKRLKIK